MIHIHIQNQDSVFGIVNRIQAVNEKLWFGFQHVQEICKASRSAMGPNQPLFRWALEAVLPQL
jgi:hypothetical protein